jgi:homocysteine S-methyltransferase
MGTLLLDTGVSIETCFEELCVSEPEHIHKIHEEFIAAGAQLIQTNTFGANAIRLARFGMENRVKELNQAAVAVAKSVAKNKDVCIAGSVGALGITAQEAEARGLDRAQCFREQLTALLDGGVDVIFFETFTDYEEMEIALRAKNAVGEALEICSFACGPSGRLSCGTALVDAFARLREIGARIVGVNCMNAPREMTGLLQTASVDGLLAVHPTAGNPKRENGRLTYEVTPETFAASAPDFVAKGARLVGGCCGTTPTHIAALAKIIQDLEPR